MFSCSRHVLALALIVASGATLVAQAPQVSGVVVDQSGGAIVDARVSLTPAAGGAAARTTTTATGAFAFAGVAPGRYVVRVEHDLFRAAEVPATPSSTPLQVTLTIASFGEAVQVSYRAPSSSIGTKIDVPLSDIPQSIQVVPLAVLRDRGVTRVEQLVETVSGVHAEASYGSNMATFFNVRGFSTSSGLRDGFRSFGYVGARDVQSVDRVEVLKGPASVLYGATSSLGGYVNTVSKQPLPTNFADVEATVTAYGARATADLNRRLNSTGTLRGRANLALEKNGTFRDGGGFHSFTAAPSVSWTPTSATDVTALVEYNYLSRDDFDFGLPNIPQAADLSRTRYFGSDADFGKNRTFAATVVSQHRLGPNWRWREAFNYVRARQRSYQSFLDAADYTDGSRIDLWLFPRDQETDHDWSLQSELSGQLATGAIRHRLLVGFEVAGAQVSYAELGVSANEVVVIDLFDPGYRSAPEPLYDSTPYKQPHRNQGVYVQDLMDVAPTVKVLAGLRVERLHTTVLNDGVETDQVDASQSSPRVGLVWQPHAATAIYGSWSRAFSPVLGRSATGAAFEPETGEQYEVGWKQQFKRATATVAVFDLRRKGVLTLDSDAPQFYVQSGEQRSRGLETDLGGESALGISWTASYTFTHADVTSDNSLPVGDRLANIPRHSGSVWATYRRRDGHWQGFSMGAGVFLSGAREATLPNSFELSGYARTDLMGSYGRGNWNARVNVLNVFNAKYFTGGSAGVFNYTVTPSAPPTLQLTLARRF